MERRVRREKGQKIKLKRKEGPECAGLVGHVKILASVLGQWEAICKCHVEGSVSDVLFRSMWRMAWRRELMY